jgi:glutathione S-transferase
MILVGQYDSPYVRRVAVTLHQYGMAFTRNPISVFADAAAMARINPIVRIPSLILESGEVLVDSGAIIDHLDEVAGAERALTPRSGEARRRVVQLTAIATGAIDKMGAYVYERHFHPPAHVNAEWAARCKGQFLGGLGHLERVLEGEWFHGGHFSQADVTTACMLGYIRLRVPEVSLEATFPKLSRLADRCEAMPAFQAARPSADEVMPAGGKL